MYWLIVQLLVWPEYFSPCPTLIACDKWFKKKTFFLLNSFSKCHKMSVSNLVCPWSHCMSNNDSNCNCCVTGHTPGRLGINQYSYTSYPQRSPYFAIMCVLYTHLYTFIEPFTFLIFVLKLFLFTVLYDTYCRSVSESESVPPVFTKHLKKNPKKELFLNKKKPQCIAFLLETNVHGAKIYPE